MKKIFFVFFLFSCSLAQAFHLSNSSEKDDYYLLIEQAENHIMTNEYTKASHIYYDAYKLNSKMFGIDLYNALLCNVYLKRWKDCEFWANKLIDKGAQLDFFKSKVFIEFKKTKEWSSIEKRYLSKKNLIDKEYKRQLDSLVIEDQKVYCSIPTGELTYNEAKENTITVEEKFATLINKYGYPTEEKVGLRIYNDTILSYVSTYDVLIRHGYQSNNSNLLEIFNKCLENGEMDKRVSDTTLNDSQNFLLFKGALYKLKSEYMDEDLANERKLKFNNSKDRKGFLIFAKYSKIGSFDESQDINEFFKIYDVFIPEWKEN